MERITNKELDVLLNSVEKVRRQLGIDPELAYGMQFGSSTNGIAYRLYGISEHDTARHRVSICANEGFLGNTKREAATTLRTILYALGAAVDFTGGPMNNA